jgi:hypothetical protein
MFMGKLIQKRLLKPLKQLLSEGLTPKKMSEALAAGFVLGMTPMLGISTLLAVGIAVVFKLNQVAIQVANWAAYPAQIIMFIPFIRIGEWVFGLEPAAINPSDIATMFSDDFQASVQHYGQSLLAGWFSWLIAAVPLAMVIRWPAEKLLLNYFAQSEVRDEEP